MNRFRFSASLMAIAALLSASLADAQTQPIPGAVNVNGNPANVQGSAIVIAPAGGGAGRGRVLSEDGGLPIQGRDTVTNLPCAIGPTATCQLPGSGGGAGSLTAQANASLQTASEGASVPLSTDLSRRTRGRNMLVDSTDAEISFRDPRPNATTITAADSGTTTIAGQGSVTLVTGTPTTNSFQTNAIDGMASAVITVTGIFSATMQIEGSADTTGTVYVPVSCLLRGTSTVTSAVTGPSIFSCETAGLSQLRLRATAYTSGTATVKMTFSPGTGGVKVLSPVRVTDGLSIMAVKPASTAPTVSDPASVVTQSPTPSLTCPNVLPVSTTTSADLVTFSATGYICSVVLVGASAETWGLVDGAGTVCATGIVGRLGGATGTMSFGANGGFSAVSDRAWLKTSGAAKHLCLLKNGAGNISGVITYADF